MKNSFIVCETNENALKTFDNHDSYVFFDFKDDVNYKLIDKIRSSSVVIMTNKKQAAELKKRNYNVISNNLFVKV